MVVVVGVGAGAGTAAAAAGGGRGGGVGNILLVVCQSIVLFTHFTHFVSCSWLKQHVFIHFCWRPVSISLAFGQVLHYGIGQEVLRLET